MNKTKVAVIGAGPGGYAAAFMAADLGMETTLIDPEANPGGVCLYRGCIPSKALLHAAKILNESQEAESIGIHFPKPNVDLAKLRDWKNGVVAKLVGGLGMLSKQRKISYVQGRAVFTDSNHVEITGKDGRTSVLEFETAVLATGSRPATLPNVKLESERLWDSTRALELKEVPKKLLVVGGGYIGLEMGSVYAALGSEVSVVEMLPNLLPGADRDLVSVLERRIKKAFKDIKLETKLAAIDESGDGLRVAFENKEGVKTEEVFDAVLVSIGRKPNHENLGLEKTKVIVSKRGFVETDAQCRTADPSIFAIGDIAGEPMLAHKASHEGRAAAEVISGKDVRFEPAAIPAVVFTDPEIAWVGLTEAQAKEKGAAFEVYRFPWAASGRAISINRTDGATKILVDPLTEKILGVGIVGVGAGDMIAEAGLAMETGATVSDIAKTIHAHPTLSETVMETADMFHGTCSHIYRPKKKSPAAA